MTIERGIYAFFGALVFLAFITATIRPFIYVSAVLAFLVLLIYFFKHREKLINSEKLLALSFLLMFFSALPALLTNDSLSVGARELDVPSRYILYALLVFLICATKIQINKKILFFGVALGGIINGITALAQIYIFKDMLYQGYRVRGFFGINEFGCISGALCVMNLILFFVSGERKYQILFLVSGALSFIAVMGSGLRGVILAIVFALFIMFLKCLFESKKIYFKKFLALVFCVLCASLLFIQTSSEIQNRIKYSKIEAQALSEEKYNTSIGLRISMYKEALAIFSMSPLIGMSAKTLTQNAEAIAQKAGTEQILNRVKKAQKLNRPYYLKSHNDILSALAKRGIIGFVCLIFLYAMVLVNFYRQKNIIGALGISLLVYYIGVGMSGDPLISFGESAFFTMCVVSLLACRNFSEKGKT